MKLSVATNIVESNLTDNHQFAVEANATMINILSGKIYSDEITAVVRELSCNAVDSHIEAGKELTPIEVTLPSELDPHFIVRDFGVGMSEEFVYAVYGTYGKSNKTHTNSLTGALGLGSKSPFAYQEAFTVVSVYDGMKLTFITSMQNGIPYISCVGRTPTDECNGVTIKVPVKREDIHKFVSAAMETFFVFQVPPVIKGNNYYQHQEMVCTASFGNVYMVEKPKRTYGQPNFYAIQANVRYFINTEKLNLSEDDRANLDIVTSIARGCRSDVYIYFDNGEVDFAASREELQYTERTVNAIVPELELFFSSVKEAVNKEIQEQPNYWEACKLFTSKTKDFSDLLNADVPVKFGFSTFKGDYYYKGRKIEKKIFFNLRRHRKANILRLDKYTKSGYDGGWSRSDAYFINAWTNYGKYGLDCGYPVVLFNDMKSSFIRRIERASRIYGFSSIPVFKGDPSKIKALEKILGGVEIIRLSEIEMPEAEKEKKKYRAPKVLLGYNDYSPRSPFYDIEDVNYKETCGFYVVVERNNVASNQLVKYMAVSTCESVIGKFKTLCKKEKLPVYYVREKNVKKLEKHGWKSFDVVLRKWAKEFYQISNYAKAFHNMLDGEKRFMLRTFPNIKTQYDRCQKVVGRYGYDIDNDYHTISMIADMYPRSFKQKKKLPEIDLEEEVKEKYPLLQAISGYDYNIYSDHINEYIQLVDNARGSEER